MSAQSPALESAWTARTVHYHVRGSERFFERAEVPGAGTPDNVAHSDRRRDPGESLDEVLTGLGWTPRGTRRSRVGYANWESWGALREMGQQLVSDESADSLDRLVAQIAERASISMHRSVRSDAVSAAFGQGLEWEAVA